MAEKKTILVIDDDAEIRKFLHSFLKLEGYEVAQASSGEEALRLIHKITPDLIITDVRMPGVSGAGLVAKIMKPDGTLMFPVLVITAYTSMSQLFKDVRIDGFLAKPFDNDRLLSEVRRILALHEGKAPHQRRVLIVDDHEKARESIASVFQAAGYAVDSAADGSDAIAKAIQSSPDVVVAKEVMPQMNAHAMTSVLGSIPKTAKIPTVIYSAKTLTLDASSDILERRGRHPVIKSDSPDEILAAVQRLFLA
jgi:CheY-like chemotaxis protein